MFNLLKTNNTEAEARMLDLPPTKMKLVASNLSVATAATGSANTDSSNSDTQSVTSDSDNNSTKQQQQLFQVDVLERIAEETYGADWNAWAHYDYDENMFEDVDMLRTNMKTTVAQDAAADKEKEMITANEEIKKRQAENLMQSLNLSTDANVNFDNNVWQPWQYDSADVFVTHNNDIYVLDDKVKKAPVVEKKTPIVEKKENPKYVERETPYVGAFHLDWEAINSEKQAARMRYMCETSLDTDNAMQGVQQIWAQGRKGAYSTKEAQRSDIVETLSFGKDYREKRLMELEMKRKALAEQANNIDKWAHRDYDCADDIVVQA